MQPRDVTLTVIIWLKLLLTVASGSTALSSSSASRIERVELKIRWSVNGRSAITACLWSATCCSRDKQCNVMMYMYVMTGQFCENVRYTSYHVAWLISLTF